MAIIGIITQNDNINEIEEKIKKYDINEGNIVIINEANAENIKNVKFDIAVIYEQIKPSKIIKTVVNNAKYLIMNTDFKENLQLLDSKNEAYVITFGFNSKSTITIISNENDDIIFEIQREIENIKGEKIEEGEVKFEKKFGKKHIYEEISMKILTILLKI